MATWEEVRERALTVEGLAERLAQAARKEDGSEVVTLAEQIDLEARIVVLVVGAVKRLD